MAQEQLTLEAHVRSQLGKVKAKLVRAQGLLPAILYGPEQTPKPLQVNTKAFLKILESEAGANAIISLSIQDNGKSETVPVLSHEIQKNFLTDEILHVDFYRVNLQKEIEASVHVVLTGDAPAVKLEGGILVHGLREVRIRCLPTLIPPHLDVPLAGLVKIGDTFHVSQLALAEGIKILEDPHAPLVQIAAPAKEEVVSPDAAAEAPAQPERIGEKKAEGEEAAVPAKGGKGAEGAAPAGKDAPKGKADDAKASKK